LREVASITNTQTSAKPKKTKNASADDDIKAPAKRTRQKLISEKEKGGKKKNSKQYNH